MSLKWFIWVLFLNIKPISFSPNSTHQIKFVAGLWQDYIERKELYKKYNFNLLIINKLKLYLGEIY